MVLNGWGVGEVHWGGFAQKARVRGEWLVPLPKRFTPLQAMTIGTAGYTAMLCIQALERHGITPNKGEVLVSGATGGVGSVAIAVLSKLGYHVVAISGIKGEEGYIKELGAKEVMDRAQFSTPVKPLVKERWAAAIDVVAGHTLANICAGTSYRGTVACCGNAGGMDFPASIAPFILRGVTLAGIDSVMCPLDERLKAWERLEADLPIEILEAMRSIIGLRDAAPLAEKMIRGEHRGRTVIDVNK